MFTYGLVFKANNELWLALFDDEGNVQDTETISDTDDVYENLSCNALSFVAVEVDEDRRTIRDLQTVTVEHNDYAQDQIVSTMMQDGYFPTLAKEVWTAWGN